MFNVYNYSLENFEKVQDTLGVVYAKEFVRAGQHRMFNERTFLSYFKRYQDELLKKEELPEEHVFQSLMGN